MIKGYIILWGCYFPLYSMNCITVLACSIASGANPPTRSSNFSVFFIQYMVSLFKLTVTCWRFCVTENIPFQVHTLSHPGEDLSWFCRSRGCLGDCTKAVYMDQTCETETQKAGNHTLSFGWCTVGKTVKGDAWAWHAYFKLRSISEIWCK